MKITQLIIVDFFFGGGVGQLATLLQSYIPFLEDCPRKTGDRKLASTLHSAMI